MGIKLVYVAAIALVVVVCANLVAGVPQLFLEDVEDQEPLEDEETYYEPLIRLRRDQGSAAGHQEQHGHGWGWPKKEKHQHHGWGWPSVGPVFTYVRTDGWSNFQWGVRHKVGNHKGWGSRRGLYPVLVRVPRGEYGHDGGGSGGGGGGGGGGGSGGGGGHGHGYLGPVYTYARTDKHANFKWGVRHHVGGGGWGHG